MNAMWIYPFIIAGGALQSCGAAMDAQLFQSLGNNWLANAVCFALTLAFSVCVFAMGTQLVPNENGHPSPPRRERQRVIGERALP
jgi:transporter family-2 protein